MIGGIGHCACGAGVFDVISTCEAIVQVGGAFDFVDVGRLDVSFTSASSLTACSACLPWVVVIGMWGLGVGMPHLGSG